MILATQEPAIQTPAAAPQAAPTEIAPPATEEEIKKERNVKQMEHYAAKAFYYWNRLLTAALTLYGINGVYGAVYFVLVTNKELNQQLELGLMTEAQVNQVSVEAAMLVLTTVIYFVLAWRLHGLRRETGPTVDLIVSMAFLVGSPILQHYVSMIDFVSLVGTLF